MSRANLAMRLYYEKRSKYIRMFLIYAKHVAQIYYKKHYLIYSTAISAGMGCGKLNVGHLQEVGQSLAG